MFQDILKDTEYESFKEDITELCNFCSVLTLDYDESHDINHHIAVCRNAIIILKKMNIFIDEQNNQFIRCVIYSCLIHDIIDYKYPIDLEKKIIKLNSFLETRLNIEDRKCVNWVINNISYSKEVKNGYPISLNIKTQLIRDIVSDADKLESIGEIGLKRCRQFTKKTNPLLSETEINKIIVQHCEEKLVKIKDGFLKTEPAKTIAEPLHQVIIKFIKQE